MSDTNLTALVDLSIGTPDGIINCIQLHKLLLLLAQRIQEIQEGLELVGDEDGDGSLAEGDELEESPSGRSKDRWNDVNQTFKEQDELLQGLTDQLKDLEERLRKCCTEASKGTDLTPEELASTAEASEEQSQKLIEMEGQIKTHQEETDGRLKALEELLATLQSTLEELNTKTTKTVDGPKAVADSVDVNKLEQFQVTQNQVEDLAQQLEALKAQLLEVLQQRDEMNDVVKKLIEDKDEISKAMTQLSEEKNQMNAMVEQLAEKAGLVDKTEKRPESAATTHRLLTDLNCVACDTEVVQRDRDNLPMAPPGKGKPKKVIRKPSKVEPLARLRAKRAVGGSHTVVKAAERVFRVASQDICRCSTSSGSQKN